MTNPNHSQRAHAQLSASGSSRWLNCPGSVEAENAYPQGDEKPSVYALEGTLAHELADTCLKERKEANYFVGKRITGKPITAEMAKFVQEYLDYVLSHEVYGSQLFTEDRVSYENVAPNGFGTLDAAVIDYDSGICHIFDLKYGQGIQVEAFENTQAMLYAIGLYNELNWLGEIKSFRMHIVQPRKYNTCYYERTIEELMEFAKYAKKQAKLALSKDAPRIPGESQCRWCAANADCPALANFTQQVICADFEDLDKGIPLEPHGISDEQKRMILDHKKLITTFLASVETQVYNKLMDGEKFPGYKLVEGRSQRKWNPEKEQELIDKLGDKAYTKKLIGITDGGKVLSKDEMVEFTIKPLGTPSLVPESDKRKPITITPTSDEFDDLSDKNDE